jgi:glucose/arabinose dehydrogenase
MKTKTLHLILVILFCQYIATANAQGLRFRAEDVAFHVEIVFEGLEHPWGMVFLSDGDMLITERTGNLRLVQDWQLLDKEVSGLPEIDEIGQGGLLGIALHPQFESNHLVYLSYTGQEQRLNGTEVLRGKLQDGRLEDIEVIFRALPKQRGGYHFGSRLVFADDGTLFISLGERGANPGLGRRHPAQQLNNHLGSLIRINDDGTIPNDNPFQDPAMARPEIYTYGNRNMQGMAIHPGTKEIWTHEHGPQGGDEVNIMKPGINYGWPVITYGANYGTGSRIGEGTHRQDMRQPLHKWVPSIAPSGMMFYTGDQFPSWQGDLFVGSLKFGQLVRLGLSGDVVDEEERLLNFEYGRIRDVVQGPDGFIYLLSDSNNGKLLRLRPTE